MTEDEQYEQELIASIDSKYHNAKVKKEKRRQQMEKNKELRKMLDELEDALL